MRTIAGVLFVVATGVVGAGMARAQDATSIAVSQAATAGDGPGGAGVAAGN